MTYGSVANVEEISAIVTETLSEDFDNIEILKVNVTRDTDFDGEDVLKIQVIFNGTLKDTDAGKLSGAIRHVRPKLSEIGEKAFPLLSFISSSEKGLGKLEPA